MARDLTRRDRGVVTAHRATAAVATNARAVAVHGALAWCRFRGAQVDQATICVGNKAVRAAHIDDNWRADELATTGVARGFHRATARLHRAVDFATCAGGRRRCWQRMGWAIAALRTRGDAVRCHVTFGGCAAGAFAVLAALVVARERIGLERAGTTGRKDRDDKEDDAHGRVLSAEPMPSITLRYRIVSPQFSEATQGPALLDCPAAPKATRSVIRPIF